MSLGLIHKRHSEVPYGKLYYRSSFSFPCSEQQAKLAIDAFQHIAEECTDFAKNIISKCKDDIFEPEDTIIRLCFENHPDREANGYCLEWDFSVRQVTEGLEVYCDESINTSHAAVFTHAVPCAFALPALVEISAAHTCDKLRLNVFGGHAGVVTKNYTRWAGLDNFLEAERKAHAESARYFICDITEINGEYEYTTYFLMKCSGEDNPEERLDEIFVSYRDEGDKEGESFVWYRCGTAAKNPHMSEITPYEFKVMQAHLSVL